VSGITVMLSRDFVKLVFIALFITSPISWWLVNGWLQGFAYRVSIPLWVFIFSGFAAMLIALLTVSIHAIKTAVVNPVKSLRDD
jgi:putative ABC transport system permease protein